MTDKLRLTIDFDLPSDLFERAKLITDIGAPIGVARNALGLVIGGDVEIKHEIVSDAPAAPTKRVRGPNKARTAVGVAASAPEPSVAAAETAPAPMVVEDAAAAIATRAEGRQGRRAA